MAAAKFKPFFRASVQSDGTLELLIYEEIGYDWWSDSGLTAKTVKQQIDQAGAHSKIQVRINSPGGDAFEGVAIQNLLRAQKKPIEVCVDGIAASAASIIAMCGDTITMGHNAMMMIHNAWSMCVGEAADMRKKADTLDKVSNSIAQTYVDRTGKSMDDVKALMDAESWLSADECLKEGFCTAIAEADEEGEKQALAMARQFRGLSKLKKVPEKLKSANPAPLANSGDATRPAAAAEDECQCSCQECKDGDCSNCTMEGCMDANCKDCPMQTSSKAATDAPADSNLSLYEARLHLLKKKLSRF